MLFLEEPMTLNELFKTEGHSYAWLWGFENEIPDEVQKQVTDWFLYRRLCDQDAEIFQHYFKRYILLYQGRFVKLFQAEATEFDPFIADYVKTVTLSTTNTKNNTNITANDSVTKDGTSTNNSTMTSTGSRTAENSSTGNVTDSGSDITTNTDTVTNTENNTKVSDNTKTVKTTNTGTVNETDSMSTDVTDSGTDSTVNDVTKTYPNKEITNLKWGQENHQHTLDKTTEQSGKMSVKHSFDDRSTTTTRQAGQTETTVNVGTSGQVLSDQPEIDSTAINNSFLSAGSSGGGASPSLTYASQAQFNSTGNNGSVVHGGTDTDTVTEGGSETTETQYGDILPLSTNESVTNDNTKIIYGDPDLQTEFGALNDVTREHYEAAETEKTENTLTHGKKQITDSSNEKTVTNNLVTSTEDKGKNTDTTTVSATTENTGNNTIQYGKTTKNTNSQTETSSDTNETVAKNDITTNNTESRTNESNTTASGNIDTNNTVESFGRSNKTPQEILDRYYTFVYNSRSVQWLIDKMSICFYGLF